MFLIPKRAAAAVLLSVLLGGCSLQTGIEDLLSPPRLTTEQSMLYDALERAVGTDTFKLKYPRRGSYLSACIFWDINHDGENEAIAFYELTVGGTTSTWMSVLTKDGGGMWRSAMEIPGEGSEIDLVSFAPVSNATADNIIVGWSVAGQENSACTVYSFENGQVQTLFSDDYSELLIDDLDKNGLDEIILCTKRSSRPAVMSMVKYRSGRVVTTSEVELPSGIAGYEQLRFGLLTPGLPAIFADIALDGGMLTTCIAAVDCQVIEGISAEDLGVYESFDRYPPALGCEDVNGDGLIDLPVPVPLPGYEDVGEGEKLLLTSFKTIIEGRLVNAANIVVNFSERYQVKIPDEWVGTVTVKAQPDAKEWRFVLYNGSLSESTVELLRIKVVSPSDYQDKLETTQYRFLMSRGVNEYFAYIPPSHYPGLSVTYDQVGKMLSCSDGRWAKPQVSVPKGVSDMRNILIAEDKDAIRDFVVINLNRAGYKVTDVANGTDALAAYNSAEEPFDVVILDVMMPGLDGFSVCKQLREKSDSLGIIMLTAKSQEMDKVNGLMLGADDYITKPFSPSELLARVDAIHRRVSMAAPRQPASEIVSGPFVLNMRSRSLTKNNVPIDLTQVEFQIMELFLKNPETALERSQILSAVWGEDYFGDIKIVDVNIRRLRMKVEDEPSNPRYIATVWGYGYKWLP